MRPTFSATSGGMQSSVIIPAGSVLTFLFVLVRISSSFVFVPIPGARGIANPARIVLCMGLSLAVFPQTARVEMANMDVFWLVGIILTEAALGIASGLLVSVAAEAFQFGAQMLSLQAGLSFATTFDPNTEADSTVMVTIAQLLAGCFFFAFGLDHRLLSALAYSLKEFPPGAVVLSGPAAEKIIRFLSAIFSTGLMTMLPVLAFLILIDIVLAMLGRLHAQLQLLTLAFPLKLMCVTLLLAWLTIIFPRVYERAISGDLTTIMTAILRQ